MSQVQRLLTDWKSRLSLVSRDRVIAALDRGAFILPAALTVVAVLTFTIRLIDHVSARRVVARYGAAVGSSTDKPPMPDAAQGQALDARTQRINQRSLFAMPPAPPPLTGIFGDEAFFGAQSVKAGGMVMNIKVVRINGDSVDAEIDGKPAKLYVFAPSAPGDAPGGGPMRGPGRPGRPGGPAGVISHGAGGPPGAPGGPGGRGPRPSPALPGPPSATPMPPAPMIVPVPAANAQPQTAPSE